MGTECLGSCLKDDSDGMPSVPPGFVSLTSFTLQRVQEDALASACASNSIQAPEDTECGIIDDKKFRKSLRHRPWVNYRQFDYSSEEEESDSELLEQEIRSVHCLPKGVIRGCSECQTCLKVTARWHPEDACRPVVDEAPVFYPNEEEFQDTIKYIASIRPVAEPYGICRIVPPPSWAPPCPLKEKGVWQNSKFVTRTQPVDKLQNRDSVKKTCRIHSIMKRKRRKLLRMEAECRSNIDKLVEPNRLGHCNNTERFGFEPGPYYTLESFQKYADDFKEKYFCTRDMDVDLRSAQLEPSVENIEGEYWRIVEKPTEEIEVLYGADLETGVFGSGFPKAFSPPSSSEFEERYVKSGWNLNNFARLSGSLLAFENGDISGVLVPWLYIGMCFSSFCWHVEDHHLYSMNYLHWGAPKVWYGVPSKEAVKLEMTMKKHLTDLFEEQPDLLHNLVTQFSPSILKSEGVPVYRCVQHSGEFVITFPRAYHSGFNCGFNCAEAVNVAPIDWLPHGQNAVELYSEQNRKISISHDKLLLGAAREAIGAQWNVLFLGKNTLDNLRWKEACGLDGILAKALKARIEMESTRREYLCSSQSRKMDADFDCNCERECIVCHYDLHLSAAGCLCSPDRFACLSHAKQLCSCAWSTRFFLFRYEISELNVLLDALGGKLSAVHRWGLSDLGWSLSSYVAKEKTQKPTAKTYSENIDQTEKGQVKQSISNGREKNSALSQEVKASLPQPTFVAVPNEREKINTVSSTCKIPDPSSLHQQNKSTTMFLTKDSYLQGGSLSELYQSLQSNKGLKGSDSSSRSISNDESSQGSMLNNGALQTTSSEKNSVVYPALVPEVKHLSNSGKLVCSTVKNTLAYDGDVKNLNVAEYEGAEKLLSDNKKKLELKGQVKQSISNDREKKSALSQEVKASSPQPTFVAVPKEREKINTVSSTCKIADPSSLHQQNKSTTMFPTKDSYLQGGSLSELYQSLQSNKRLKGSDSSLRSISNDESSQGSMLNIGALQTTSTEKNYVVYPALVPEVKHLSNSGKLVCSTVKNTLANDGDVKNLNVAEYEGAEKLFSDNKKKLELKGQVKQSISNDGEKNSALSQEVKASSPQPTFVAVPKEREKINTVSSTCKIPDPSSLHQQNKSTTMFPTKDSYLQGGSLVELYQSLQSNKGLKGSDSSSRSISNDESFQGSMLNVGALQTTSSEKNSVVYPALVPEVKHLSNSGKLVCSTVKNTLANDGDVKNLNVAEYEGAEKLLSDNKKKQPAIESSEYFARLANSDDKVNFCSSQKDLVLVTPEINASVMSEKDVSSSPIVGKSGNMPNPVSLWGIDGKTQSSRLQNQQFVRSYPQNTSHSKNSVAVSNARQNLEFLIAKGNHEFVNTNVRTYQSGSLKTEGGIKGDKSGPDFVHKLIDKTDSITASTSGLTNSMDRSNCPQRGPRMAKVVRRMNYSVEPLEYGVVLSGKLWSTGKAIFPKGFRSRVRYFSVLDPTQMCTYISEILDAGLLGPLFMVSVEQSPSEVFFHVSATKCWDMVREQVNQEIRRQHNLGIVSLPPLQPPGSLDGLDMFGLTSPKVIQAIEAIDEYRVCSEYWRSRPEAPTATATPTAAIMDQRPSAKKVGTDAALRGLLKKANPEALQILHSILSNDHQHSKQEIIEILGEEIESRSRSPICR